MRRLFIVVAISMAVFVNARGQNIKFDSFQQYCTCDSNLFSDVESDSILNISIIREDVLSVDLVSQSNCYAKHWGAVKFSNDSLSLMFLQENFPPPKDFQVIGYKPKDFIEMADCSTHFLFGFVIKGVTELPKSVTLNGIALRIPEQ